MAIAIRIKSIRKIRAKKLLVKINELTRTGTIFVFLFALSVFYSCEKTSDEQETTFFDLQGENGFVGTVEGTNAFVSILLGEEEGIAYVCNGDEDISEWFSGPVSDVKDIRFTNSKGAKITAILTGNSFNGELVLSDGRNFSFNAGVNNEVNGGIYKVIDEKAVAAEIKAGWIVRSEEDQRGSITFQSRQLPNITLSKINFGDISDGTSNTLSIKGTSFSFFRYKVKVPTQLVPSAPQPIPIPYPNIPTTEPITPS